MVVCKFYRQGNCRYGQYCQFEHVNHFGNIKADFCSEDEIPIMVAKEVLLAERGGQWLLSCFAPLRDRPSIPGMEDVSPEEIRWEMYQAQKSGVVEQAKLRFQQLCQDMKAKREALKNPNRETVAMLKKLLGSGQKGGLIRSDNTAGKSSTFSFAVPQLGLANNASSNNVFGKQTFGVQSNNPFGGGFTATSNTSLFGRSNNNTAPLFGSTPTFGNNLGFGSTTNAGSIFSGTTNASTFNSVQNPPAFGVVAPQTNPIFGGASPSIFGQQSNSLFGATSQLTSQSTSSFDNNATSSTLFNNPVTSQANTPLFGGAQTTNLFGSSSSAQTNSVFGGATTSSGPFNAGIFSQPKTLPAFGGAPVFGGVTNYASNSGAIFGTPAQTFSASGMSTNNLFGGSTATTTPAFGATVATPVFGLGQQPAANTFGTTVSTPNAFSTQNNIDTAMSVGNNAPFGGSAASINHPFVTASSQFGSTSTTSTSFAGAGFGLAATSDTFGNTAVTSSTPLFANTGTTFASSNAPNPSPFSTPAFGNLGASPFGATSTTTTATTTTANPFAPRTQQDVTPFGSVAQNQSINGVSSSFGKLPFNITETSVIIDDSVYSRENQLTDDEKQMYLADKFIPGKVPLNPPTKDLR